MTNRFNFEKLTVYQKSKAYVVWIYGLLRSFPREEHYALCDQLRRAAVSVTSNIAEGISRANTKEKVHFLDIAYGSLMETYSQLDVAVDLQYINKEDLEEAYNFVVEIVRMMASLKRSYIEGHPVSKSRFS